MVIIECFIILWYIFHWWIVSTFRVHSFDHTCNWRTASSALLSTGHSLRFHGFFDMRLLCGKWVSPFFTIIWGTENNKTICKTIADLYRFNYYLFVIIQFKETTSTAQTAVKLLYVLLPRYFLVYFVFWNCHVWHSTDVCFSIATSSRIPAQQRVIYFPTV